MIEHNDQTCLPQAQLFAKNTVALLDKPADPERAFNSAFFDTASPADTFDYHWNVTLAAGDGAQLQEWGDRSAMRQQESRVEGLVRQALASRATLVRAVRRSIKVSSSLSQLYQQSCGGGAAIHVSALLQPSAALRLVDVGPPADDARVADKFRKLWGNKSELRRFQDGKITETLVWECAPANQHTVPDM